MPENEKSEEIFPKTAKRQILFMISAIDYLEGPTLPSNAIFSMFAKTLRPKPKALIPLRILYVLDGHGEGDKDDQDEDDVMMCSGASWTCQARSARAERWPASGPMGSS